MKKPFSKLPMRRLRPWIVPIVLIILWQVAVKFGWLSTRVLPAPSDVLVAGVRLATTGELSRNICISTIRAAIGFLIGGSIGFVLGLLSGLFRVAAELLDTSVQMIQNIPHLALIPLVILWFGIGEEAKIFLVALGVFFPIYLNTYQSNDRLSGGIGLLQSRDYQAAENPGFEAASGSLLAAG